MSFSVRVFMLNVNTPLLSFHYWTGGDQPLFTSLWLVPLGQQRYIMGLILTTSVNSVTSLDELSEIRTYVNYKWQITLMTHKINSISSIFSQTSYIKLKLNTYYYIPLYVKYSILYISGFFRGHLISAFERFSQFADFYFSRI